MTNGETAPAMRFVQAQSRIKPVAKISSHFCTRKLCFGSCRATVSLIAVLALGLLSVQPISSAAKAQPTQLTKTQSDALNAYNDAVNDFKSILAQRRAQINSHQQLPNLPGQALYLARINVMSTYKDLTDALPSKIGRPNKFGIPPAYFDADTEPL